MKRSPSNHKLKAVAFVSLVFALTLTVNPIAGIDISMTSPEKVCDVEWWRNYGGPTTDDAYSVLETPDGGYIVGGTTHYYGAGCLDGYLVKTDSEGKVEWTRTVGGKEIDYVYYLEPTSDGGYIIGGMSRVYYPTYNEELWIAKTDSNGYTQWSNTFGGWNFDGGYSAVEATDTGYAVAGYTLSFAGGTADFWLVKTFSNGTMQWNGTYGGGGEDVAYCVDATSDGGYVLAGYIGFSSSIYDFWLVKTDENGSMQWNKRYGGGEVDQAYSVEQTSDGGYIIAGSTYSFGAGGCDAWLIKTDESGNMLWNKTYGGPEFEIAYQTRQTSDGGYVLAGYRYRFSLMRADLLIIKTDSQGNTEWTKTYSGAGPEKLRCIHEVSPGEYIAAGSADPENTTFYDFLLIKLKESTVVQEEPSPIGFKIAFMSLAVIVAASITGCLALASKKSHK